MLQIQVPSAVFFFGMCVLHLCINDVHTASPNGMVIRVGRKLLQVMLVRIPFLS